MAIRNCVLCKKPSNMMCQRCEESYCSKLCQSTHWHEHKYVCTPMPALVPFLGHGNVGVKGESASVARPMSDHSTETTVVTVKSATDNQEEISSEWRKHVSPPMEEFECKVSSVENDGSFWVIEMRNATLVEQLCINMAGSDPNKTLCRAEDISVGDLVTVAANERMFRGEVLSIDNNAKCAQIRLIDYGIVVVVELVEIYLADKSYSKIMAYSMRLMLLPHEPRVQVNQKLNVQLVGVKTSDGIDVVKLMPASIPLCLPIKELSGDPEVVFVTTFVHESPSFLLKLKKSNEIDVKLTAMLQGNPGFYDFTEPKDGQECIVAARINGVYQRAFLIDYIEKKYLVYEIDNGRISITNKVKRIPAELLGEPLQLLLAIPLNTGEDLSKRISECMDELRLKLHGNPKEQDQEIKAGLWSSSKELCAVRIKTFTGQISDLGYKYWRYPLTTQTKAYITHVFSYKEICISHPLAKKNAELFKSLESKCLPFKSLADVEVGNVVLVALPEQEYFRAEVVTRLDECFEVLNIDAGSTHLVPGSALRMSCRFLRELPVVQWRGDIKHICKLPEGTVTPDNMALRQLTKICEEKTEMLLELQPEHGIIDLLDDSAGSLANRLLPLLFIPAANNEQPAQRILRVEEVDKPQPPPVEAFEMPPVPASIPSPPATPVPEVNVSVKSVQRYYFKDLPFNPVPLGNDIHLLVLNAKGLQEHGYFTGCYMAGEAEAIALQESLELVAEVGTMDKTLVPGYSPEVGELCLAVFAEDDSWNRGVCLELKPGKAHIMYVDFGNQAWVPLTTVKPIPKKLLKTVYSTKCFIDGFYDSPDFLKLENYLCTNIKIGCSVFEGPDPNSRRIQIPQMDQLLAKK